MIQPLAMILGAQAVGSIVDLALKKPRSSGETTSFDNVMKIRQKNATNYQKAISLIGAAVEVKGASGATTTGFVEKVEFSPFGPLLQVNGQSYTFDQLQRVITRSYAYGGKL